MCSNTRQHIGDNCYGSEGEDSEGDRSSTRNGNWRRLGKRRQIPGQDESGGFRVYIGEQPRILASSYSHSKGGGKIEKTD